jgi:preprotein translocase subunit SecY
VGPAPLFPSGDVGSVAARVAAGCGGRSCVRVAPKVGRAGSAQHELRHVAAERQARLVIQPRVHAGAPPDTWYYKAATWINGNFSPTTSNLPMAITYNALYFVLTFGFTYFYTAITFETNDVADNMKRYASFIPGIRLGAPTGAYLSAVMNRITFAGACFLGFITVILPIAADRISGISQQQMYLGGTAILIVVGVALDTMRQLQTQLVMRQYRGFIR